MLRCGKGNICGKVAAGLSAHLKFMVRISREAREHSCGCISNSLFKQGLEWKVSMGSGCCQVKPVEGEGAREKGSSKGVIIIMNMDYEMNEEDVRIVKGRWLVKQKVVKKQQHRGLNKIEEISSVQSLSRVRLCDPMDGSPPGLPTHHQLPEFTQTHTH